MTEVEQFDHHSRGHAQDPVGVYQKLRDGAGSVRSELYGGFTVFSRAADIARVAEDHEHFSNALDLGDGIVGGITLPHNPAAGRMSLAEMDPPEWRDLRRLFNPMFKPAVVAAFAPRVKAIVDDAIDRVIEAGECDLVWDICSPAPAIVTMEYIGLPTDEWERFAKPIHRSAYTDRTRPDSQEFRELRAEFDWIFEQIRKTIADRRANPGGSDLLGLMLAAADDAEGPLDDELVFETAYTLLIAGVETTTSLLGSALMHLDQHPQDRERLIREPSLMPTACEEFLRYYSPSQATARTVSKDAEVAGEQFGRGDRLLLAWASASRDEHRIEQADEFILDRRPNRHFAFGHGIHRCVGASLARLEFVVAVERILDRMPDYRVDREQSHTYPDVGLNFGYVSMPATFTAGERVGPAPS